MSRHLKPKFCTATLSAMVSLALSMQVAQAATVGATNIISSQNEPLAASIDVNNIDADNFSASVASNTVYQQMDMSTDVPIQVQFVKTSPTTGKLILSSSQPVTQPYADVVLVLNEAGEQQPLPKTLLLPISDTPIAAPTPIVASPIIAAPVNSAPTSVARPTMAATSQAPSVVPVAPVPVAPINIIEPIGGDTSTASASNSISTPNAPANRTVVVAGNSISPSLPVTRAPSTSTPTAYEFPANSAAANVRANATVEAPAMATRRTVDDGSSAGAEVTVSQSNTSEVIDSTPIMNVRPSRTSTSNSNVLTNSTGSNSLNNSTLVEPVPTLADSNMQVSAPPLPSGDTNLQSEILSTQITRRYKLPNGEVAIVPSSENNTNTSNTSINATSTTTPQMANTPASTASGGQNNFTPLIPAPAFIPSVNGVESNLIEEAIVRHARNTPDAEVVNVNTPNSPLGNDTDTGTEALQASNNTATTEVDTTDDAQAQKTTSAPDIGLSNVTYVVQRNDNLWTIANQIARRNRVDVATVMSQIQTYNEDAFINGNPSLLKANAELAIPAYDVIPSRLGIRAATAANRSTNNSRSTSRPSSPSSNRTRPNNTARTTAPSRPAPRPNVTLVTPTGSGNATSNGQGGHGLSSSLSSRVQQTRQQTADEARRVAGLNSQLTEYTQKLQLQNQRLSDLESRLRELRQSN